jgi:hypothetical protein
MPNFKVQQTDCWSPAGKVKMFKIVEYKGPGANFPTEGYPDVGGLWKTSEEAEAAANRVNSGDETGIKFASFSDD